MGISTGIASGDFQWGFPRLPGSLAALLPGCLAAWQPGCVAAWHENIIIEANGVGKLRNELKLAEDGATHLKMALARPKRLWRAPWGQKCRKMPSPPGALWGSSLWVSLLLPIDPRGVHVVWAAY